MPPTRRLIRAPRPESLQHWQPPAVRDPPPDPDRPAAPPVEAPPVPDPRLAELQARARREGFEEGRREGEARGYREGRAAGEAEVRDRVERLEGILKMLASPLAELDRQVEESLAALAVGMARHLVRRELKADPGQVIAVVREAVGVLPVASRTVRLCLHPSDAALVRERLKLPQAPESTWEIIEDPTISRGGCRVETEVSQVDATVEHRLGAVVARVLGEERESERAA